MNTSIKYVRGDATAPVGEGQKIIVHCCNDIGAWGAGFVLALSRRWKKPEHEYRKWHSAERGGRMTLGDVQFVLVEPDTHVANIIGQRGCGNAPGGKPIRYEAIASGLVKVRNFALKLSEDTGQPVSVHMPRMGCGLAGGLWNKIEDIVKRELADQGVPVTVYDL